MDEGWTVAWWRGGRGMDERNKTEKEVEGWTHEGRTDKPRWTERGRFGGDWYTGQPN